MARTPRKYNETGGEILERYVRENFKSGQEFSIDDILRLFAEEYPMFDPKTVRHYVERYTTNAKGRVHYNCGPEHDLLFRINEDWNHLRLYRPGEDPAPIYKIGDNITSRRKKASPKQTTRSVHSPSLIQRHRSLLQHLATYGELTPSEEKRLEIFTEDISDWLNALLIMRPRARVVSPLFLLLSEGNPSPAHFITSLATQMMGDSLKRSIGKPLESLEEYVWQRFGQWHLFRPHEGNEKWYAYLHVPVADPVDRMASEKLDLFAHLPHTVIGDLIRNTDFLAEQQKWSAQAADKGSLGPLSRQMKQGFRRPLFLSHYQLPEFDEEGLEPGLLSESDVIMRGHVVSGLPLFTGEEWAEDKRIPYETVINRLLDHPLYALLVQFGVQKITSSLSGELAANLREDNEENFRLDLPGGKQTPLWTACRTLLSDLGFWPATWSVNDAHWETAVRVALSNLKSLGVMEQVGDALRLTESFASEIKARPAHPQNRGEKAFRVRLLQFLESMQGGSAHAR